MLIFIIILIIIFILFFFLKAGKNAIKMTKQENRIEKEILLKILDTIGEDGVIEIKEKEIFKALEIKEPRFFKIFLKNIRKDDDYFGVMKERYDDIIIPVCLKEVKNILKDKFKKESLIYTEDGTKKYIIDTYNNYYILIAISSYNLIFGIVDY